MSHENLQALEILSEVALGLILFANGSVFEFRLLKRYGQRVLKLTLIESAAAMALVVIGMFVLGQEWQICLLLGAISIATAPASTLMVIPRMPRTRPAERSADGHHRHQQHPVHHRLQPG